MCSPVSCLMGGGLACSGVCGGGFCHGHSQAKESRNRTHPRRIKSLDVDGKVLEYDRYGFCDTELGSHGCTWLCCICRGCACFRRIERNTSGQCHCGVDPVPSEFADYGDGVALLFKQLKYMAWIFFIMTVLMTPVGIVYWFGDGILDRTVTVTDSLALLSLGNLGEGTALCKEISEGERFTLACPPGATIGKVEAYYGDPKGSCTCPTVQTPSPGCGGIVNGLGCSIIPGGTNRDLYCHLASERTIKLPSGTTISGDACCASAIVDNRPDFSALDIKSTTGCDSWSAIRIFSGLCVGKQTCAAQLSSRAGFNYTWTPNANYGTDCQEAPPAGAKLSAMGFATYDAATKMCTDHLETGGGLARCASQGISRANRKMKIIATCYATELNLFEGWWILQKESIGAFISFFDFVSITIFLVAVWYLSNSEAKDALMRVRMTAADFTVFVPSLPKHLPEKELRVAIWVHFTNIVRHIRGAKKLEFSDVQSPDEVRKMLNWKSAATPALKPMEAHRPLAVDSGASSVPTHHTRRSSGFGGATDDAKYPVVADVQFGRSHGRLLQMKIGRGNLLRKLEYALMKLKIVKQAIVRAYERKQSLPTGSIRPRDSTGFTPAAALGQPPVDGEEFDEEMGASAKTEGGPAPAVDHSEQVTCLINADRKINHLRKKATLALGQIEKLNFQIDRELKKIHDADNELAAKKKKAGEDDDEEDTVHTLNAPVSAYVTFTNTSDRSLVLDAFPDSVLWRCCCQKRYKLLRDADERGSGYSIRVLPAPPPNDVNFENLEVGNCSRCCRQLATIFVTLVILGVAAVLLYLTEDKKREFARLYPTRDCRAYDPTIVSNKSLVVQDQYWEFFNVTSGNTGLLECHCRSLLGLTSATRLFSEVFEVPSINMDIVPLTDSNYRNYLAAFNSRSYYPGAPLKFEPRPLCADWFNTFLAIQALIYGSAAITLAVNIVVRVFITCLVSFERLSSKTDETKSRAIKLFLLQFLNTGALVLILNAQVDTNFVVLRRGDHRDFSAAWYSTVGVSFAVVMLANVIIPHLTPAFFACQGSCKRCWDRRCLLRERYTRALTQEQLNNIMSGPDFLISERVAQVYNIIFVCLVYSTGIPLLLPIATLSLLVFWAVDFWLFIRLYRTPAPIDGSLSAFFSGILPFGAMLHLFMGMWMLSNEAIFPPNNVFTSAAAFTTRISGGDVVLQQSTNAIFRGIEAFQALASAYDPTGDLRVGTRITRGHVLPLLLLLLLTLIFLILSRIVFMGLGHAVLAICPCLRRLGCCMTNAQLLASKAVVAQLREVRAKAKAARERQLGLIASEYPEADGRTADDETSLDTSTVVTSDEDDQDMDAAARKAAKRAALEDRESLAYRLERGEAPTYWQAVPTHILQEIHSGKRRVTPGLESYFNHAFQLRQRDILERKEAVEVVISLARDANSMKQEFDIVSKALEKRRAEESKRSDARKMREEGVSKVLKELMKVQSKVQQADERFRSKAELLDTANKRIKELERKQTKLSESIETLRDKVEDVASLTAEGDAVDAIIEEGEPGMPNGSPPSAEALTAAQQKVDESQAVVNELTAASLGAPTADASAAASSAAASSATGEDDEGESDGEADGKEADDTEHKSDKKKKRRRRKKHKGGSGDASDAKKAAVAAEDAAKKEAEAKAEAVKKLSTANTELAKAMAAQSLLLEQQKQWTDYEKKKERFTSAFQIRRLQDTQKENASQLKELLRQQTSLDRSAKTAERVMNEQSEKLSEVNARYLTELEKARKAAQEAGETDEASRYQETIRRASALDDVMQAHQVEVAEDDDGQFSADRGAGTSPSLAAALAPRMTAGMSRFSHASGHSFHRRAVSIDEAMRLSVSELEVYFNALAETYRDNVERAKTIYREKNLGVDLKSSVSGAQFMTGVHSYDMYDTEAYRSKLGLDLQVPRWIFRDAEEKLAAASAQPVPMGGDMSYAEDFELGPAAVMDGLPVAAAASMAAAAAAPRVPSTRYLRRTGDAKGAV
jgi:hypothetical protein